MPGSYDPQKRGGGWSFTRGQFCFLTYAGQALEPSSPPTAVVHPDHTRPEQLVRVESRLDSHLQDWTKTSLASGEPGWAMRCTSVQAIAFFSIGVYDWEHSHKVTRDEFTNVVQLSY